MNDNLEDDELEDSYVIQNEDEENSPEEELPGLEEEDTATNSINKADYKGKLTDREIAMSSAYDDISAATRREERISVGGMQMSSAVVDAISNVIRMIPKNTSITMAETYVKELLQTQGHNRIPQSVYVADVPNSSATVDARFTGDDDSEFNKEYFKNLKDHFSRFVEYLSKRDLSKDSKSSQNRKRRQLPAFIILLFSTGLYDLITNCPTMPKEYDVQINNALKKLTQSRYNLVEELAKEYEKRGRQKVADRVRKEGTSWFEREPGQIQGLKIYADLGLTYEDMNTYRQIRPRYLNVSKNITQDFISDYIEVVQVPGKINEKLKDKTRAMAIDDVKQVYKKWSEENPIDSDLRSKLVKTDIRWQM